jgi:hypothetical protein
MSEREREREKRERAIERERERERGDKKERKRKKERKETNCRPLLLLYSLSRNPTKCRHDSPAELSDICIIGITDESV